MTAAGSLNQFESGHVDLVHDAEFDYYGKRMATCSSDRTIKIFDVLGDQVNLFDLEIFLRHFSAL